LTLSLSLWAPASVSRAEETNARRPTVGATTASRAQALERTVRSLVHSASSTFPIPQASSSLRRPGRAGQGSRVARLTSVALPAGGDAAQAARAKGAESPVSPPSRCPRGGRLVLDRVPGELQVRLLERGAVRGQLVQAQPPPGGPLGDAPGRQAADRQRVLARGHP